MVSCPKIFRARTLSTIAFRGMIHFSERASTEVLAAPVLTTNSRASTAEAPPPIIRTFLPWAVLPSSIEEW